MQMECIWYDCSLKITRTIVWVSHTHIFPFFTQFQANQLKLVCLVLWFWGEKGEISHCISVLETSIKNTGSSKTIMKGTVTFHVVFLKETNSPPTQFPCTVFPEEKKEVTSKWAVSQVLLHSRPWTHHQGNRCIINPLTVWNCKIICKQERDAEKGHSQMCHLKLSYMTT